MRPLSIIVLAITLLLPTLAEADAMSERDIRSDIIGRTMYVATPLGGELPINYHSSGQMEGTGRALGFAAFDLKRKVGRGAIRGLVEWPTLCRPPLAAD